MTDVRLRLDNGKAHSLGDVPFSDLDSVIPFIKSWGLYSDDYVDTEALFGQFVYEQQRAFFEVCTND